MKMDLSSYIGRTVKITAFVKTQDKKIRMGLDTTVSEQLIEKNASDDWVEVSAECTIPEDLIQQIFIWKRTEALIFMWMILIFLLFLRMRQVLRTTYNWYGIPMKELCSI